MTIEQTRGISRRRRELQEAVQDAREDYRAFQSHCAGVVAGLPSKDVEATEPQLATFIEQMKIRAERIRKAEQEFQTYAEAHPTPEELSALEKQLVHAQRRDQQRDIRERFTQTVVRRVELMTELEQLEYSASAILREAKEKFPSTLGPDLPHQAGLELKLERFLPEQTDVWLLNLKPEWGLWAQVRRLAESWIKTNVSTETKEQN